MKKQSVYQLPKVLFRKVHNPYRLSNFVFDHLLAEPNKQRPSSKLAGLFSSFVRRDSPEVIKEESTVSNGSVRYAGSNKKADPIGSHVALCAVLLDEWLHELAALSMEHAVHFTPCNIPIAQV